jgi:DNA-binding LytR/AlgR family response regulator
MESFCDVHRSYIVNLYHRKTMNKTMTRIFFPDGPVVYVSRSKVDEFLKKIRDQKGRS